MIELIFGSIVYSLYLINCYDGDSCKVEFINFPEILAIQDLRFADFDTPEINGKCDNEKELAFLAKTLTSDYMKNIGLIYSNGKKGKFGRLLITAPDLKKKLLEKGLAKHYDGGKRESWCE